METYYAHSQNKKGEWETVEHHLKRVGKLCAEFAQPLRCDGFGRTAGLLHDAGKYSPLFQRVLRHQQVHVDHAVPGAVLACAFGGKAAHTLGVIIRAHHSSLQEDIRPVLEQALRGTERNVPPKNDTLSVCGPDEYTELMKTVQRETGLDLRHDSLQQLPDLQNSPDRPLAQMLQTRMLYSCLVDADYSQIELRVLAHVANDRNMIQAFLNNDDIHRSTAAQVFHMPEEMVTPIMRSRAKAVNFGIVYGIGAFSLAKDIGVTRREADTYIKDYLSHYSGIDEYMKRVVAQACPN